MLQCYGLLALENSFYCIVLHFYLALASVKLLFYYSTVKLEARMLHNCSTMSRIECMFRHCVGNSLHLASSQTTWKFLGAVIYGEPSVLATGPSVSAKPHEIRLKHTVQWNQLHSSPSPFMATSDDWTINWSKLLAWLVKISSGKFKPINNALSMRTVKLFFLLLFLICHGICFFFLRSARDKTATINHQNKCEPIVLWKNLFSIKAFEMVKQSWFHCDRQFSLWTIQSESRLENLYARFIASLTCWFVLMCFACLLVLFIGSHCNCHLFG